MKLSEFNVNDLDLQRMGSWPAPVKAVFIALILIVLIAGGWFLYVKDKRQKLETEQRRETELLQTFEQKQKKVVNLKAYEDQLAEMREILNQMVRQLPSRTEMPDLLVDISQTALSTGIDNQKFQPGAETVKEFYAEKPISLRMVGSYHQFGSFVSGVASLPRVVILTMHDISLQPQGAAAGRPPQPNAPLVLEGTVKTYRYLDESETQQAQATAPAASTGRGRR